MPFTLIGQTVEVTCRGGRLHIAHGGHLVAEHDELAGKYHPRILPEHGLRALARTARRVRSSLGRDGAGCGGLPELERRDLAIYEALATAEGVV